MSDTTLDDVIAKSFTQFTRDLEDPERTQLLDAGKRASDHINGLIAFMDWDELRRKWIAIHISDGSPDTTLYDSKRDAVKHQSDEMRCLYLLVNGVGPGGTSPRQMAIYIKFNRDLYARGFRMPDPDNMHGGPDVAMTSQRFDEYRHIMPPMLKPSMALYQDIIQEIRRRRDRY